MEYYLEPHMLVTGFATLFLVILVLRYFLKPLKFLLKILINMFLGFIGLWLINNFGGAIGFFLPINLATITTVGFLGIPGVILLVAIKYILII